MALRYPYLPHIGMAILLVLLLASLIRRKRGRFYRGIKVANTSYVKKLPLLKNMRLRYLILKAVIQVCLICAVLCTLILSARPYRTETVSEGVKKRDIFLCMDVSASTWSLNTELVHALKDVIEGLNGDRFGVLIFNTSPLLYVPMTDDYDFVNMKLDELLPFFAEYETYYKDFYIYNGDDGYLYFPDDATREAYDAWRRNVRTFSDPVTIDNSRKGSSLIGVGLASCLFSFPRFGVEDRTRIVIMSTDNADESLVPPPVDLPEASELCAKNNVTLFGIFPDLASFSYAYDDTEYADKRDEFRKCVEKTGGAYYEQSSTLSVPDIVKAIRAHEAMRVDDIVITRQIDQPFYPLAGIFLFVFLAFLAALGLEV